MKKVDGKTYSFRVPTKEYEKLQKKVNVIAAEEGLQVWEVIDKAIWCYNKLLDTDVSFSRKL